MVFKEGNTDGEATRFKAGESGNPEGMKPGFKNFRTLIRDAAETEIDYKDLTNKKIRTTAGNGVILSLLGRALYKNDTQAAKLLIEHVDGKQLDTNNTNLNLNKDVDEEADVDQEILDRYFQKKGKE